MPEVLLVKTLHKKINFFIKDVLSKCEEILNGNLMLSKLIKVINFSVFSSFIKVYTHKMKRKFANFYARESSST